MPMRGTTLTFTLHTQTGTDSMGNPIMTDTNISVDDCLIAPVTEPANEREAQAMQQSRDQVRIHLPKAFTGDISNSDVTWDGKKFHLDSDSVKFMAANTPTRWDRYIRAEAIGG